MWTSDATAPGKLFLSGEYAVLDSAQAVITSVDRRVKATCTTANLPQSNLLRQVANHVRAYLEERAKADVGRLPNLAIESHGFSHNRRKLGIGSSAAVAAAGTAALFQYGGVAVDAHLDQVANVAISAHRAYQNGRGSGADVATAVFGGTICFNGAKDITRLSRPAVSMVFIWSGAPASTVSLVEKVKKFGAAKKDQYRLVMDPLTQCAAQLAEAFETNTPSEIIRLAARYGHLMDNLGRATKAPIVTPQLRTIADLAARFDGGAKPSGAGGGDVAVAFFNDDNSAQAFVEACKKEGFDQLEVSVHVPGVTAVGPGSPTQATVTAGCR